MAQSTCFVRFCFLLSLNLSRYSRNLRPTYWVWLKVPWNGIFLRNTAHAAIQNNLRTQNQALNLVNLTNIRMLGTRYMNFTLSWRSAGRAGKRGLRRYSLHSSKTRFCKSIAHIIGFMFSVFMVVEWIFWDIYIGGAERESAHLCWVQERSCILLSPRGNNYAHWSTGIAGLGRCR
jgi:hypothetical protein